MADVPDAVTSTGPYPLHCSASAAASLHDGLNTPISPHSLTLQDSPGLLRRPFCFDEASALLPTEPGHVEDRPVTTPLTLTDAPSHPDMNLIVGGALAPLPTVIPPPLPPPCRSSRATPGFRLPSFEALGIASAHPERFGALADANDCEPGGSTRTMRNATSTRQRGPRLSDRFDAAHIPPQHPQHPQHPQQLGKVFMGAGRVAANPYRHDVATLTPPAETGDIVWNTVAAAHQPALDSPATDAGGTTSNASDGRDQEEAIAPASVPPVQAASSASHTSWVDGALQALLQSLRTAALPANPMRVLSHALPSPSTSGHIFPAIIDGIHGSTPAQPTVWINVFHAIQGRFNLADLPTSPPSTPGPAIGGDDYFTQKVFDTAVPISDYQQDLSSLPRSPRPVVPPSSINVSIVERYIPPSSTHEFEDMFNPSGPSILVDRLVELSPNNGTLIFVYPTRTGAETFMRDYLGPLLDPQLRALVVVNGLSSNLSRSLGRMAAVDHLPDYESMHRSMVTLCSKLTQRSSTIERFHGRRATFSLVYASREEVHVGRNAWSRDWWAKQEKQRIREMMTRYAQDAQKQSSNEHMERSPTPTELIQQLLDGVTKKSSYPSGQQPKDKGLEVSVFVIKRSS